MPERPPKQMEELTPEKPPQLDITPLQKWKNEQHARAFNVKNGAKWLFWAPEHIEHFFEAKRCLFWMPTKRDVEKILAVAMVVHGAKPGPIRVLDIGGGNGFLDKLLIDAAREKMIDLDCTVVDPAREMLSEARDYYASKDESHLHFVDGKIPEHPELKAEEFDVVLNSWMWGDLRDDIRSITTSARIYVADRMGATGDGVDTDERENSYSPEPGFQDFGSWPAMDHASIQEEGYNDVHTTTQILVQLPDEVVAIAGERLLEEMMRLDEKTENQFRLYPWEESLRAAREEFLGRPYFERADLSKRERKTDKLIHERKLLEAKEGAQSKWWKFRRGGDWRKYIPPEKR